MRCKEKKNLGENKFMNILNVSGMIPLERWYKSVHKIVFVR